VKLNWSPRPEPLPVEGCWAQGTAALELEAKLKARGLHLQLARYQDGLAVLSTEFPWVDQLTYLGREGQIYMPTTAQPDLPNEWLVAGLQKRSRGPWILLPPDRVLTLP
jgi:hypothetical protein